MPRGRFTDALLLRAVDYRDADRIVTLLTADLGKVSAIARGARRSRRRFAGALEPYAVLRVEITPGRGELSRLGQSQQHKPFPAILRDLRKMTVAGAAFELVREIVPAQEPDSRVFDACVRFLEVLDSADFATEELLLLFQARVAALAGLSPGIDTCTACGTRAPEGKAAHFDPVRGGIVCRACGGGPLRLSGGARAHLGAGAGASWHDQPRAWLPRDLSDVREALAQFTAARLGRRLSGQDLVSQVFELPPRDPGQ